jgi:uncharacterized protein with GYD domain
MSVAAGNTLGKKCGKEITMVYYSLQTAYTPLGWAALMNDPQDRLKAVKPVVERLGGSIVHGWFTFGDYDLLLICEMPDDVSAAALSIAISAGGAVKAARTTPLMTFEKGLDALRKAKEAEYAPPASEIPYFGVFRAGT